MHVSGTPNKFEIFQDFYYVTNGVQISYSEALRLFSQMDADTIADFEKYYQDETGYEIIVSGGFNLEPDLGSPTESGTKTVKRKVKQPDGSIKWVDVTVKTWAMGRTETLADGTVVFYRHNSATNENNINTKYTLDAYAKKNGLVLDPQWAIYSAEEIMQMVDEGVNVPQDVIDIANTIMQSTASSEQAIEGEDGQDDTTLSFLELIPLAEKKIEKCDKNNEKIEKEIEDLLPEQEKRRKNIDDQMKEQRRSLKEYESFVREWNHIQTKINNGEALSTSEARRYADLMGMFEEKKSNNDKGFSLDKREIAKSMNDINILAILGEKLADETIEIGDTLADYTSQANYKTTRNQAQGEIGFLRAIVAMAQGKALAKEANITGNDTKDYTVETQHSVNDIAQVLDIGNMIAGKDEILGAEQPKPEGADAEEAVNETDPNSVASKEETNNPEVTEQEDFIINDKNVKELIKEASDINIDLAKQTISAVKSIKVAKDDRKFAQIAGAKVTKLVKEFKQEEEERQARIQAMEQENKEANQELENLTGKSADELNEEQPTEKTENTEKEGGQETEQTDKEKVAELRQKIASNNEEIENIKAESEASKGEFANATAQEREVISKAIPAETEALQKDTEYKEEIIPAAKERLNFTDASGETLSKIGTYRIELGMMQIMAWQFEKGLRNVALGTISTGIGLAAQVVGDSPIPTIAEKATDKAVKEEDGAINDLTTLEAEIISVTGEDATQVPVEENDEEGENDNSVTGNDNENTDNNGLPPIAYRNAAPDVDGEDIPVNDTDEGTEPPVDEPAVDEPAADEPPVDEPAADEPPVDEPAADEPPVDEPTVDEPAVDGGDGTSDTSEDEEDPDAAEKDAGKQQDIVDDAAASATDDGKASEKIRKNTEKDEKQLEKQAKRIEKEIHKEQEQVIKLNEASLRAVERQQVIMVEYETLSAESEQIAAEEEAKQMSQPNQQPAQQEGEQGGVLASNSFTITSSGGSDNQGKLEQNSQRINELGIEFKSQDRIVVRNRKKITKIEKSIKTKTKKFEKTTKLRTKVLKETEKKEKQKQKRLAKQLAIVGIAENVFSITSSVGTILSTAGKICISTGTPMLSNPFTAAAGAALVSTGTVLEVKGELLTTIGTYGTVACGVTKGIINIANGNLAAGLMAIGSAAISAVTAATGTGGASSSALNFVTAGLQIVSSSAEMVNNVRAVQGKEASGIASKIGTIAGVGSAVTGAASSVGNMGGQNTLGKISTITSAVGTALSSTSQIMTEFGGDEKTANLLGTIGGGLQTLGSIGQLANQNNNKQDDDSQDTNNSENNDEKVNKAIDNDKNLTPEQKAEAKAAIEKMKNDPEFAAEMGAQADAVIDKKLNEMGVSDKVRAKVKEQAKKAQNAYKQPQQPQQPQGNSGNETTPQTNGQGAPAAPAENKKASTSELQNGTNLSEAQVNNAADALRNENPAQQSNNNQNSKQPENIAPNGKKLPAGYKNQDGKVIGPNGQEVKLDAKGNVLKADHKQQIEDAKAAQKRQKDLANGTDDKNKKKEILNGSSEYYSDMNDEQLKGQLTNLQGDPNDVMSNINGKNSIGASKLQGELDRRQQYRNQMDLLKADKQAKMDKFNQIVDITGQAANTAMQVAGVFMSQEGETKKKQAAPGKLTKRTREIMRKNAQYRQRRVQALAKVQKYYA